MRWVEGVERTDDGYMAVAHDNDGLRTCLDLAHINDVRPEPTQRNKRRLAIDLQSWQPTSAKECLEMLGFRHSIDERHAVFCFEQGRTRYLVPAAVLITALFRPYRWLAAPLFRPQGLEQVCLPDPTAPELKVRLTDSAIQERSKESPSIQQPLWWMWYFPSARHMWNSVYAHARNGRLALDLPQGALRMTVRGVRCGRSYLVTELVIVSIATAEKPFDFAPLAPREIIFHGTVTAASGAANVTQCRIRPGANGWELTDAEWAAIKPHLGRGGNWRCHHDGRALLNGILRKVGTGMGWRKVKYGASNWALAHYTYNRYCCDGRWQHIENIVNETRPVLTGEATRQEVSQEFSPAGS